MKWGRFKRRTAKRARRLLRRTGLAPYARFVRIKLHPPVSNAALRYCTGRGLEIGAAVQNPFCLNTRNVDFTDSMDTVFKREERRVYGIADRVDIVAAADRIPVPDASEDFIVSSHVLEHLLDPIRGLLEWDRIVRSGGVIFMIVPHKERTFDEPLPRTPLSHVVADYENRCVEPSVEDHGHEHVWITEDVVEIVEWMMANTGVQWTVLEVSDVDDKVGNGFTIVIRKDAPRSAAGPSPVPAAVEAL